MLPVNLQKRSMSPIGIIEGVLPIAPLLTDAVAHSIRVVSTLALQDASTRLMPKPLETGVP